MSEWATYVQTASWAGAAIAAAIGVVRFWQDTRKAREQQREATDVAQRELDWRRASAAQTSIEKMELDPLAADAVLMIDWDGREFPSGRPNWQLRRQDVLHALRVGGEPFTKSEVYVRDSIDRLLWHFERIQQQIDVDLIDRKHIRFPLGYIVALVNEHPEPFERFMNAYGYKGALRLMGDLKADGLPELFPDYEQLFHPDGTEGAEPRLA